MKAPSGIGNQPRLMFKFRKMQEGTYGPILERIAHLKNVDGVPFGRAVTIAYEEAGYEGPDAERAKFLEMGYEIEKGPAKPGTFEEEIEALGLPATADPVAETEWVKGHPAMLRQTRKTDRTSAFVISVKDILDTPHGPPPSQWAVTQLCHWANNIAEWHKKNLNDPKKMAGANADKAENVVRDIGLDEVRESFKQMRENAKKACGKQGA